MQSRPLPAPCHRRLKLTQLAAAAAAVPATAAAASRATAAATLTSSLAPVAAVGVRKVEPVVQEVWRVADGRIRPGGRRERR